ETPPPASPVPQEPATSDTPPGVRGTWFARLAEVARWVQVQILVYLLAASATVFGVWKLFRKDGQGSSQNDGQGGASFGPENWEFWVGLAVAVVPALAVLVAVVLPEWLARRRRRKLADSSARGVGSGTGHFRLGPYGEEDQDEFRREDGAHA